MKATLFFLLKWIFFLIFIKVICSLLIVKLTQANVIGESKYMMSEWVQSINDHTKHFLIVAILAPIMEELLFRGVLTKSITVLAVSTGILGYFLVRIYCQESYYEIDKNTSLAVLAGIIVFILSISIFQKYNVAIHNLYAYRWFMYLLALISSLFFADWHRYMYSVPDTKTLIVYLIPHFFTGLVFCYITLNKGIEWSILLHITNNSLPVIMGIMKPYE